MVVCGWWGFSLRFRDVSEGAMGGGWRGFVPLSLGFAIEWFRGVLMSLVGICWI